MMGRMPALKSVSKSVLLASALFAGAGCMPFAWAQVPTTAVTIDQLTAGLDAAASALEQLDALALQCQPALTLDEPGAACRQFLTAMHGQTFREYTTHCASVRQWRDEQIESRLETDTATLDPQQAQALLENLMRAEYLCGQDALSKRSDTIVPVYHALDGNSDQSQSLASLLQELRFRQMSEQQRWQGDGTGLSARQRQETDELFERQQRELLRQEMQRELLQQENWRN